MRLTPQIQNKKEQIQIESSPPGTRRAAAEQRRTRARMSDRHGGVPPRGRATAAHAEVNI